MTKEKLVTFESVAGAAESLVSAGERISGRAIIKALGGGSPNDVHEFLRQWHAGRPVLKMAEIQVDPKIGQLIADQISRAVAESRTEGDARLLELEADANNLATTGRELQKQVTELSARLEAAQNHGIALTGRISQLEADAESVKTEAAADVLSSEEIARSETKLREAAQVDLAKAQLRLESLPHLECEISDLRKSLETERSKRTDAERDQASMTAKAAGLSDRFADAQQQAQRAISLQEKTESELVEVRNALAAKTELAGTQAGTIASLEKQLAAMAAGKVGRPKKGVPVSESTKGDS